jgi:cytochrome c oxidase subunit 1
MTTVEDATQIVTEPRGGLLRRPRATTGFWSWFTTVDHKKIGILYVCTALGLLRARRLEALLIRLQLFQANGSVLTAGQYNQLFTMHGTTMVFLMGMPLAGRRRQLLRAAHDRCARRRVPAHQHVRVLGGAVRRHLPVLELLPRRRAERGWFGYTPLTSTPIARVPARAGPDFWAVGLIMLGIGVDDVGDQLHRHDPQHARARHDAHAMPVFVVDDARGRVPHAVRDADHHRALIMVFFDRNFGTNFFSAAAAAIRCCTSTCSGSSAIPRCTS